MLLSIHIQDTEADKMRAYIELDVIILVDHHHSGVDFGTEVSLTSVLWQGEEIINRLSVQQVEDLEQYYIDNDVEIEA